MKKKMIFTLLMVMSMGIMRGSFDLIVKSDTIVESLSRFFLS
ncbi:hypothetical protein [Crassaminicella profunda]|nr:hypothetical protein [Crassaminicella profunda]